jgi:hypothetical protein
VAFAYNAFVLTGIFGLDLREELKRFNWWLLHTMLLC